MCQDEFSPICFDSTILPPPSLLPYNPSSWKQFPCSEGLIPYKEQYVVFCSSLTLGSITLLYLLLPPQVHNLNICSNGPH